MKVPYFVPWITSRDKKLVNETLTQRWLTNGPNLQLFEKKIKKFIGTKYAVGVGNATQALHLTVKSLGIQENDEVLVPTFTFVATANSVIYSKAKPVLVDVEQDSFNISLKDIKKKITKKTKAIIVVHYGGQACDMNEIMSFAKKYGLFVIEDCAHALGSMYENKMCGNIGDAGCFSFYPTKIITTGEGGMITTNKKNISQKTQILKSQGMDIQPTQREKEAKWKYDIVDLGYNYRLDEIRSALGISQMNRIKEINQRRIKIAKKYNKLLEKIDGITIPKIKSKRNHIFHLYTIKIEKEFPIDRNELFVRLHKKGIGTSVQYYPIHMMSYYKKTFHYKKGDFPNSENLMNKILCLPIFPTMSTKQVKFVVNQIKCQ